RGWNPLITESELLNAIVKQGKHFGNSKLGVDVAGEGRNDSVIIRRSEGFAEIKLKDNEIDTTSLAAEALALKVELEEPIQISPVSTIIPYIEIAIDKIGVGLGPFQTLKKQTDKIRGVVGGAIASDTITYFNKRAENYWRVREWILAGGKLIKDGDLQDKSNKYGSWKQLLDIKYKINADKKVQIISKDLLREAGVESPDIPDALANTFETKDIEMKAEGTATVANKKRETHI
ncbi:MAG: hypothetical protein U9O65_01650, partial [Thermotogota bacterium]|nr:hypothetical protein [Thermotogota bacterium]